MKREIMRQSYEQILNDCDVVEVKLTSVNKKAKFNLVDNINKKLFIISMIEFYKSEEDYEKCSVLNNKLKTITVGCMGRFA